VKLTIPLAALLISFGGVVGPKWQMKSADKSGALQTLREFLTAIRSRESSGVRALERRSLIFSELTLGNRYNLLNVW